MTPEQIEMRDKARAAAIEYGFTAPRDFLDGELRAPPGKFEGEPYYVLFYYDATMTDSGEMFGNGERTEVEVLDVTDDERAAFELGADTTHIALGYSESGFVHLTEGTEADYQALVARYAVADEETDAEE